MKNDYYIGKNIKRLRKLYGMTQNDLAEAVELSVGYLALVETNQELPSTDTLRTIANYFEIPVCFLTEERLGDPKIYKSELASVLQKLSDDDLASIHETIKNELLSFAVNDLEI